MEFVSHTLNVIESKSQVDTVYTDIRKAFDRVRHSYLLRKLHELGFDQSLIDWIGSYLIGREQYVKLLGHRSRSFAVSSGLPPRSFIVYFVF